MFIVEYNLQNNFNLSLFYLLLFFAGNVGHNTLRDGVIIEKLRKKTDFKAFIFYLIMFIFWIGSGQLYGKLL